MESTLSKYQPQMLSIMRIMFGLLFLSHGLQKWFGFPVPSPGAANINAMLREKSKSRSGKFLSRVNQM